MAARLKKYTHRSRYWPKENAAFVAAMEDVIAVYHRRPTCLDEAAKQSTAYQSLWHVARHD